MSRNTKISRILLVVGILWWLCASLSKGFGLGLALEVPPSPFSIYLLELILWILHWGWLLLIMAGIFLLSRESRSQPID